MYPVVSSVRMEALRSSLTALDARVAAAYVAPSTSTPLRVGGFTGGVSSVSFLASVSSATATTNSNYYSQTNRYAATSAASSLATLTGSAALLGGLTSAHDALIRRHAFDRLAAVDAAAVSAAAADADADAHAAAANEATAVAAADIVTFSPAAAAAVRLLTPLTPDRLQSQLKQPPIRPLVRAVVSLQTAVRARHARRTAAKLRAATAAARLAAIELLAHTAHTNVWDERFELDCAKRAAGSVLADAKASAGLTAVSAALVRVIADGEADSSWASSPAIERLRGVVPWSRPIGALSAAYIQNAIEAARAAPAIDAALTAQTKALALLARAGKGRSPEAEVGDVKILRDAARRADAPPMVRAMSALIASDARRALAKKCGDKGGGGG